MTTAAIEGGEADVMDVGLAADAAAWMTEEMMAEAIRFLPMDK